MPYRKATGRDRCKVLGYTLLTMVVIVVTGLIIPPLFGPAGILVWLVVFAAGSLLLLVRWHARNTAYRCPACGHEFEISVLSDLISPHVPDKKYLKCPECGERKWARVLMKEG